MREIFGRPKWVQDTDGISHTEYTLAQGLFHLFTGIVDRAQALAKMRLMLLPKPWKIGKRNRTEWALCEVRVGATFNEDKDQYEGGFIARVELCDIGSECEPSIWERTLWTFDQLVPTRERFLTITCYTPEGYRVGNIDQALKVYGAWGLTSLEPLAKAAGLISRKEAVDRKLTCAIGFDPAEGRWVGWSHRSAASFKVGHVVREGNCEAQTGWIDGYAPDDVEKNLSVPVGFKCETLADAKRCAIAFAESVA